MSELSLKFEAVKKTVTDTVGKKIPVVFPFDSDNSQMTVKTKNTEVKASLELALRNLSTELGLSVTDKSTKGSLKFSIKL